MKCTLELPIKTILALSELEIPEFQEYAKSYHRTEDILRNKIDILSDYIYAIVEEEPIISFKEICVEIIKECDEIFTEDTQAVFFRYENKTACAVANIKHCAEFLLEHEEISLESMTTQMKVSLKIFTDRVNEVLV